MTYDSKYNDMIASIKAVTGAQVATDDFFYKEELLSDFTEQSPFKDNEDEIRVLNDNSFIWNYNDNGSLLPMGEFHLNSFEDILRGKGKLTVDTEMDKDKKQLIDFIPFDEHPQAGDGVMGCFRFMSKEYEIWLHNENGEMIPVELTLRDYIIKMFELKAVFGWQYLFTNINWKMPVYSVVKSDLKKRLEILAFCFPDSSSKNHLSKIK